MHNAKTPEQTADQRVFWGLRANNLHFNHRKKNHKKSQKVGSLLVILSILCTQLIIEIKFGVFEFDYLEEIDKSSQIQAIWFKSSIEAGNWEIGPL